ncbi:chitin deacetylase [Linnemannia zychae]|nr:chitin deacetylase [Linnemannia zychae]
MLTREQIIKMLSPPAAPKADNINGLNNHTNKTMDYHGVIYQDEVVKDKIDNEHDDSNGAHGHGKSRMNMALYPPLNKVPDVNSPQVKAWVAEIDWSKVPNIPVAPGISSDAPHFPKCPPDDDLDRSICWWSCDGCTAPTDIITCPSPNAWGLNFDDGPSLVTRNMTKLLADKRFTATFFVIGSHVLEYPDILRETVAQGHHIGMHTWSHSGLTTLTNQEIVAEIRWTEKAIRDVTGLTMKYVRPPFGDIDNRVREILRQMGYTIVIWTKGWDTNDWRMLMHEIPESEIINSFKNALDARDTIRSANGQPAGPITLEHDSNSYTVQLSRTLMNMATSKGLQPMNIATCLNDPTPYQRGSKLGPNGAVEKINGGDSTGNYMGMKGMEEQDYNSDPARSAKSSPNARDSMANSNRSSVMTLKQSIIYAIMGLIAVSSFMLAF